MTEHIFINDGIITCNLHYCKFCGLLRVSKNNQYYYESPSPIYDKVKFNNKVCKEANKTNS
jgi:hypothetical protein